MRSSNYNNAHSSKGEGLPHNVKLANEFGAFEKVRILFPVMASFIKGMQTLSCSPLPPDLRINMLYKATSIRNMLRKRRQNRTSYCQERLNLVQQEDLKWFMEAMQAQTIDVVKRMKEITLVMQTPDNVLEEQGVSASDLEGMLDELQEHVEPIDMANDHHTIRGLPPLLKYLSNSHANIRAKAAEVELNERPVRVSLATARVTRTELGCISRKKRLIRCELEWLEPEYTSPKQHALNTSNKIQIRNAFRKLHN
ncbi:HSP70 nucleotide exchange factor FES1-like protein [Tanacetum coccineum]